MQDPDIPPAVVEEGETGGAVGVVHPIVAVMDAIASSIAAFTPLPWITVTAHTRVGDKAEGAVDAQVSAHPTHRLIPNLCQTARTRRQESLPLSTICFSWRRFRRQRASSTSRSSLLRAKRICWIT